MDWERRTAAPVGTGRTWDSEDTLGGWGRGLPFVRRLVVTDRGEVEPLEAEGGGLDVCEHLSGATAPRRRPIVVRRVEGDGSPEDGEAKASPKARVGQLVSN